MATILFDDTADALLFGESAIYETLTSDNFIGGSAVAISEGSLRFTFSGIAISVFGRTNRNDSSSPSAHSNSIRSVPAPHIREIIIDSTPRENNVIIPDQVAIGLIYQIRGLSDSTHVLGLSDMSSVILDFIEVTAGDTTRLSGSTLLLNSSDSAISYEGNWTHNRTILVDNAYQHRQPIGDTTRDTNSGDASVTVSFAGTSISVWGTRYSDPEVLFSPSFFVDGKEQLYRPPLRSGPNYPWFSSQQFSEGDHVLKIDLSGNTTGGHFSLEYITYSAALENLETNSQPPISPSVFIGVGVAAAIVVCGILIVMVRWKCRRHRRSQETDTPASRDVHSIPQDREPGLTNQSVEESPFQSYPARVLTPHDSSMTRHSTGQRTSVRTSTPAEIQKRLTPVRRHPEAQQQPIIEPLNPRRKSPDRNRHQHKTSEQSQASNVSTNETGFQIRQLQEILENFQRDMALSGVEDTSPDHSPTTTISGGIRRITHSGLVAEGYYGMEARQLEGLIREFSSREGTIHSELEQDQVGTGLSGLIEEIRRNQARESERLAVHHRNAI